MRLNPMARIRREHAAAIADMKTLEALSKAVGPSAGLSQRELEQRGLVGAARRLMTSDSVRQHHARFVITGAGRKRLLDLRYKLTRASAVEVFGDSLPVDAEMILAKMLRAAP